MMKGLGWKLSALFCVLLVSALAVGYNRVLAYIHSSEFSEAMSLKVGDLMGAEGEFEKFTWNGMHGENDGFTAVSDGGLAKLEAENLSLDVKCDFLKREEWELRNVEVGALQVDLDLTKEFNKPRVRDAAEGLLEQFLPKKAALYDATILRAGAKILTEGGDYEMKDVQVELVKQDGSAAYDASLSGGYFKMPLEMLGKAYLKDGEVRFLNNRLHIDKADFEVFDTGKLGLEGEVDFNEEGSGYALMGALENLQCADVIPEDWKQQLFGEFAATFSIEPRSDNEPVIKGEIMIKDGKLTALPILDSIAAFTMVRDFKTLRFSNFRCHFEKVGQELKLNDIYMHCDGLIRVEGALTIDGDKLDGKFYLGLTPGTLSHIPGAEDKVFLPGKEGMSWTTVVIGGTTADVKEDLSGRLLAAAGDRMLEMVGGKQMLKYGGEVVGKVPGGNKVMESGKNVLEAGKDVLTGDKDPVQAGSDVLQQGLNSIFGGGDEPEEEKKKK
ncbi:hypothetical protein Rhal01_02385 [Rubritalea halochordaticola]|uniref:AsmA-like C-terminal domain-containing protein n=2 Tax=Rubritalea halochordaticola TaxID=714537 RepID=A0ABP9V0I8_9BACT